MEGVDSLGQGLFFNASQAVANQNAFRAQKNSKSTKTQKTEKKAFSSALEKSIAEEEMRLAGLPAEIAGMDVEEAAIFLKDAADIAADKLKESQMPEVFAEYRRTVGQFIKFVVKNNYEVVKHAPSRLSQKRGIKDPKTEIVVINQKLDELARWMLSSHRDQIDLLSRVDEINGLLVDLMAS